MVTIVLPVSREQYLDRVFTALELMNCNREETNLLTVIDGDYQLFVKARNLTVASKFNQRLSIFRNKGKGSVGSIFRRRQRIADIHNEIKALIEKQKDDYVFVLEDDTLVPTNALTKLMDSATASLNTGLVSGLQIGRWGITHIGAWVANDVYDTTQVESIPLGEGLRKVDGTGLYCAVMRKKIYLEHNFAPFETGLGPDFNLGITLRREGYQVYVDQSVKCAHLTPKEDITFNNSKIEIAQLTKLKNEKWALGRKE